MSIVIEDPLTLGSSTTKQPLSDSSSYCNSLSDANENIVQSKEQEKKSLEPEKIFDFLVWNHKCNDEEASRIYEVMEKRGLRGYIYDRDKIAGQYKLIAMEQAIENTSSIILLISSESLKCSEFSRKMHASSKHSVIPIYIGLRRSEFPRLLRHHVEIRYKNDDEFWDRLYIAITRPRMDSETGNLSKTVKKEPPSYVSPTPRKSVKPVKVVPTMTLPTERERQQKKSSSPSSSRKKPEKKWFSSIRSKQKMEKETPEIQMQTITTKP